MNRILVIACAALILSACDSGPSPGSLASRVSDIEQQSQETTDKAEELETKVTDLENKVDELESRIDELEANQH